MAPIQPPVVVKARGPEGRAPAIMIQGPLDAVIVIGFEQIVRLPARRVGFADLFGAKAAVQARRTFGTTHLAFTRKAECWKKISDSKRNARCSPRTTS